MTNIAKLLKDCPKGTKLYSPLFGEVEFVRIDKQSGYPIDVTDCKGNGKSFTEFGVYFADHPDAECLLFPSKEVRTWDGWEAPVEPNFKAGDWIIRNDESSYVPIQIYNLKKDRYLVTNMLGSKGELMINRQDEWHLWSIQDAKDGDVLATNAIICIFKKLDKDGYYIISPCTYTVKGGLEVIEDEDDSIGSCGFKPATKEDRELLFRKMKEAGYTWDEKKKVLKKVSKHYDISNFQPFDKVLVRCSNDEEWMIEFYCKYDTLVHTSPHRDYPFMGIGDSYSQCIPYNDDTKHLLGTTDMCPEEYVNW